MRIIQIREDINYGDEISNTIVYMDEILSKKYNTVIAVRKHSKEISGRVKGDVYE